MQTKNLAYEGNRACSGLSTESFEQELCKAMRTEVASSSLPEQMLLNSGYALELWCSIQQQSQLPQSHNKDA